MAVKHVISPLFRLCRSIATPSATCTFSSLTSNENEHDHNPPIKMQKTALQKYNIEADGIRIFLENITTKPREARMWLKYFKDFSAKSHGKIFAVLQLESGVFRNYGAIEKLAWSASFLHENRLMPLIVCDLQPGHCERSDINDLKLSLFRHNTPCQVFENSAFLIDDLVTRAKNSIPIVAVSSVDSLLHETVDDVTVKLCAALHPLKVMLLTGRSGLTNSNDTVISDVLLPGDYDRLVNEENLSLEDKRRVRLASLLLKHLTCESSVILTGADTVIQELFTHHGAGTMFRLSEKICKHQNLNKVNIPRMLNLISEAFRKPLKEDYIERVESGIESIYISERYNAAALITRVPEINIPYLDKIAVSIAAQGNGLSAVLWNEIVKDYPQLFWRTTVTNKTALSWYFTVSQGSWKTQQDWTIFWYGLENSRHLGDLIEYAESKPSDFYTPDHKPSKKLIDHLSAVAF